jgi:hypothetical protein
VSGDLVFLQASLPLLQQQQLHLVVSMEASPDGFSSIPELAKRKRCML